MKLKTALLAAAMGSSAAYMLPEQAAAFQSFGTPETHQHSAERPRTTSVPHAAPARPSSPLAQSGGRSTPSAHEPTPFAHPRTTPDRSGSSTSHRPGAVGGNVPRPGSIGGNTALPSASGGGFPRPGSIGGSTARPSTFGDRFPRPGSIGGSTTRPSTSGDRFPRPSSIGGNTAHPNTLGDRFPRPGSMGGNTAHPNTLGDRFPRPGSMGGNTALPSALGDRFPRPSGKANFGKGTDIGANNPHALPHGKDRLMGAKANFHGGPLVGFGKNPVETAKDVGSLERQLTEAQQTQQEKKKVLTENQGAERAAVAALNNASLQLVQAMSSGNPLAIANAQNAFAQAKAAAGTANAAVAKAATDLTTAQKTTADISKDLSQNRAILKDQIRIEELQRRLREAQGNFPVVPGPVDVTPVDPGPAFVGPAPVVVGPAAVVVGPAPVVAPALTVPAPRVATVPATTPPPAPPATLAPAAPEFILVAFKPELSAADLAAFLQAYKLRLVEGPNSDGVYRLQLNEPLPADKLPLLVDSIKSQTNIVSDAAVN